MASQKKGWMTAEMWMEFLMQFNMYVNRHGIKKPMALFVDGFSAHLGLEAAVFCRENDIILYTLLQNTMFIIQPFDVGIFGEMKQAWNATARLWIWQNFDNDSQINKFTFPLIFHDVWKKVAKPDTAKNAFRLAGLCPFTPENVDYSCLVWAPSKQRKFFLSWFNFYETVVHFLTIE